LTRLHLERLDGDHLVEIHRHLFVPVLLLRLVCGRCKEVESASGRLKTLQLFILADLGKVELDRRNGAQVKPITPSLCPVRIESIPHILVVRLITPHVQLHLALDVELGLGGLRGSRCEHHIKVRSALHSLRIKTIHRNELVLHAAGSGGEGLETRGRTTGGVGRRWGDELGKLRSSGHEFRVLVDFGDGNEVAVGVVSVSGEVDDLSDR
jgi:hypothetical protein